MAAPPQAGPLPPGWFYNTSTGLYYAPDGRSTPNYPGPTGAGAAPAPAAAVAPAQAIAAAPAPAATVTPSVNPYTTTTANTATAGPSITGQGLFSASPYLINDQAITGAPAQGAAQDYGLNPVWANLQSALAGNQVGANGQTAIAGNQAALGATLANQANGGGMSPADLQLQAGQQSELANQLALLGSQRGGASGNPALAARMAQEQAAAGQAGMNQQLGIQRAQETLAAQNALGGVLNQQMSGAQSGQQLYNQEQLAALGAQTGIGQSQQSAALANQQLQVQQQNAVNQVNEAGFGNAAQANANFLSSLMGAGGSLASIAAQWAKAGGAPGTSPPPGWVPPSVSNGIQSSTDVTPSGSPAATAAFDQPAGTNAPDVSTSTPDVSTPDVSSPDVTLSGNLNQSNFYGGSDENMKTGVGGGNPMLQSFLTQYNADKGAPAAQSQVTSTYTAPSKGVQTAPTGGTETAGQAAYDNQMADVNAGVKAGGSAGAIFGPVGSLFGSAVGAIGGGLASELQGGVKPGPGQGPTNGGYYAGMADNAAPSTGFTGGGMSGGSTGGGFQQIGVTPEQQNLSDENAKTEVHDLNEDDDVWHKIASLSPVEAKTDIQSGNTPVSSYLGQVGANSGAATTTPKPYYGGGVQPASSTSGGAPMPQAGGQPFLGSTLANQGAAASGAAASTPQPAFPIAGRINPGDSLGGRAQTQPGTSLTTQGFATGQGQQPGWQLGGLQAPTTQTFAPTYGPPTSIAQSQNVNPVFAGIRSPSINAFANMTSGPPPSSQNVQPFFPGMISQEAGAFGAPTNPGNLAANVGTATTTGLTNANNAIRNVLAPPKAPILQAQRNPLGVSDEDAKTDIADPEEDDVQGFLDSVHAHSYRYKNPNEPGAGHGTFVSPMAQEIEKTDLGKNFVFDGPAGHKMVDYGKMAGTLLAAQAMQNERLNDHERMIASMRGR